MPDEKDETLVTIEPAGERLPQERREPPVVARLVVEIRSDGTHTIARGALHDAVTGQDVAVQAEGTTPLALAMALAKSMLRVPTLFGGAMKLLGRKKPR